MVSIRRLRAVLLFAVISAIAWTVIGTIIMTVFRLVADMSITVAVLTRAATVFASLGFAAGATWSVAVAMLPRKHDQAVTPLVATLAGALGGVLVATGMYIAMGNLSLKLLPANLVTLGMAGGIGGAVGLLIQRGAARGQLPGRGGRLRRWSHNPMAQIVTFVIFGGFGLVMLYVGVTQWQQQRRNLANAVRVDAVIVHSEVFSSTSADTDSRLGVRNSTTTHRADVRFRYRVLGTEYESDLMYPTSIVRSYAGESAATAELAAFPLGAAVRAYVDREQAEKAFLAPTATKGPVVFIVIGLLLPPLAWFVGGYV